MEVLVLLFFTAMASAFVQSTTGFGYGILFMAIAPFYQPIAVASVLSLSTSLIGNTVNVSKRIAKINWRQVAIPIVFSTIATYISIDLTKGLSMDIFRPVLGVLLFVLAIWFLFFSDKVKIKGTFLNGAIVGLISGVGTGLFSISGPPMVLYYLSALDDKESYMATIQTYFLCNSVVTLVMKFAMGVFPVMPIAWFAATVLGLLVGVFAGQKLYRKLNGAAMKKYIYGFMALSGLWIFIQG